MVLSPSLLTAIETVGGFLRSSGVKWLLGGSCGLILQQVALDSSPRDLDLYMDHNEVEAVFRALEGFSVDNPHFSQTDIYESILSHYRIEDIQVEAVGSFRVAALGSKYKVEAAYLDKHHRREAQVGRERIPLTPLAHELLFNILRNRPDRYEAIALVMLRNKDVHMPACMDLLHRNQWSDEVLSSVERLLQTKL